MDGDTAVVQGAGKPKHIPNPPPNHLLQSQVFRRQGSNSIIKILPMDKINFTGFQPNQPMRKIVKVLNTSRTRQRFHIIPPQSEHFTIEYKKFDGPHVPGTSIPITVTLHPIAWKTYTDAIRIHCPEPNDNLIIPLHAYPSVDTSRFPARIDFKNLELGSKSHRTFTIWSKSSTDMEYSIQLKDADNFKVQPNGVGTIPAGNSIEFKITYTPKEYCTKTTILRLQVGLDGINPVQPLLCQVSGNCKVKKLSEDEEIHVKKLSKNSKSPKPPKKLNLQSRTLSAKTSKSTATTASEVIKKKQSKQLSNITTHHGVNQLLLKGLHGNSQFITHSFQQLENQQAEQYKSNESDFLKGLARQEQIDRSCRVKWVKRIGNVAVKNTKEIKGDRDWQDKSAECYNSMRRDSFGEYFQGRVPRKANSLITVNEQEAVFNIYNQNDWWRRREILRKFKNAALIILLRVRADRVLAKLKLARTNDFEPINQLQEYREKTQKIGLELHPNLLNYTTDVNFSEKANTAFDWKIPDMLKDLTTESPTYDAHYLMGFKDETKLVPIREQSYSKIHKYRDLPVPALEKNLQFQASFTFTEIQDEDDDHWMLEKDRDFGGDTGVLFVELMERSREQFVKNTNSRENSARLRAIRTKFED